MSQPSSGKTCAHRIAVFHLVTHIIYKWHSSYRAVMSFMALRY